MVALDWTLLVKLVIDSRGPHSSPGTGAIETDRSLLSFIYFFFFFTFCRLQATFIDKTNDCCYNSRLKSKRLENLISLQGCPRAKNNLNSRRERNKKRKKWKGKFNLISSRKYKKWINEIAMMMMKKRVRNVCVHWEQHQMQLSNLLYISLFQWQLTAFVFLGKISIPVYS